VDRLQHTPCCQWATQDEIDGDPDLYNCDTCEVRSTINGLDDENLGAWRLYHHCASRFLVDAQAVGAVFVRLTADQTPEQLTDTCERMRVLYDALQPPRQEQG
jgi:hypothetical protein